MTDTKPALTEWSESPAVPRCHRDGCHSAADFHVGLELQCGAGFYRQQLMAPTTLKVCRKHMRAAGTYVLSPQNRNQIAFGLMSDGMPLPDFSSAKLVFVPIGAKENDWKAARQAGMQH